MIKRYLTNLFERDVLTIICTFAAIGIVALICEICLLIRRRCFGRKYLEKFIQLIEGGSNEGRLHQWLLRKVSKIQNEMGSFGVATFYKPPFANYAIKDYEILSNTLLNINPVSAAQELKICQAVLECYIGALDECIKIKLRHLINPVIWLTRTVRLILLNIPLWLLKSSGLISGNTENKIRYSSIISKLIGLLTIVGSLFSLISGWNTVKTFFHRFFG